jgi:succinate dehydrogenase / fumarate reductase cytochrome b subunit
LNWLFHALSTSVGRKFVMGLTGLFLCLFLVVHLGGNLLLYVGADVYNEYAEKLHAQQEFLILAEILLYTAFLLHIALAFRLTSANLAARLQTYRLRTSKREDRMVASVIAPEAWMFRSGAIVLLFLLVHVTDFKFEGGWGELLESKTPFEKAGIILTSGWRAVIYAIGSIVLGAHVSHGFASAWQSIGINHPKWNGCLKWCSIAFGWVVGIGFASFPVMWFVLGGAGGGTGVE